MSTSAQPDPNERPEELTEAEAEARIVQGFDGTPLVIMDDGSIAGPGRPSEYPVDFIFRPQDVRADVLSLFLGNRLDRRLAALEKGARAHQGVLWIAVRGERWVSLRRECFEHCGGHVHQIVGRFASLNGGECHPEAPNTIASMIEKNGLILIQFSVRPRPSGGCEVEIEGYGGGAALCPPIAEPVVDVVGEIDARWPLEPLGRESGEVETTQGDQQQSEPWRPDRPADFNKWCRVWQLIRRQVDKGDSIQDIATWLKKAHPDTHPRSEKQLGLLRLAGEAGLLDRTV